MLHRLVWVQLALTLPVVFYAGAPFIVRGHSFRETDWAAFKAIVDNLIGSYSYPGVATG